VKPHLRSKIKQTLAAMSKEAAAQKSRLACRKVIGLAEFRDARAVMIYLHMADELDTAEIAEAAWEGGKVVLVPKVSWRRRDMVALRIHSIEKRIVERDYGLREPIDGEPWPVEEIDFIVVPALAFDRRGHRLGHGAGFYDRFLARPGVHAATCGLGFAEQCVEELPVHANDWPVDMLVTDEEVLRFNNRKADYQPGQSGMMSKPESER
jgi:5-formyltetrahydrofolate cyclo-ligase